MRSTRRQFRRVGLGLAALLLLPALVGCPEKSKFRVRLFNNSNVTLEPYVVKNLARVPEGSKVAHGDTFSIEAGGFNVAFYSPAPVAAGEPNAAYVQMSHDPTLGREFLTRVYHNAVAPGQEGSDPANQPASVNDYPYTAPANATGVEVRIEPDFSVTYKPD